MRKEIKKYPKKINFITLKIGVVNISTQLKIEVKKFITLYYNKFIL